MAGNTRVLTSARAADELMAQHASVADKIWIAVAWASLGSRLAGALSKNMSRIEQLVVGLDFHRTEPDFLQRFRLVARVVASADGTFHPKVYVFRRGDRFDAIVGSSNLTNGGLGRNVEVNLHFTDSVRCSVFKHLVAFVEDAAASAPMLTNAMLRAYQQRFEKLSKERTELARPPRLDRGQDWDVPALDVSWSSFVKRLRRSGRTLLPTEDSLGYVGTAEECHRIFRRWPRFAEMPQSERRKVAGVDVAFLHFGSMRGAGNFKHLVDARPQALAKAIDRIPLAGSVDRATFEAFVAALPGSVGLATATRLLAMKRPDLFLCVDSLNVKKLTKEVGITLSGRERFERYWTIMERVWRMPWWTSAKPHREEERRLWANRVALLDAFYYDRTA